MAWNERVVRATEVLQQTLDGEINRLMQEPSARHTRCEVTTEILRRLIQKVDIPNKLFLVCDPASDLNNPHVWIKWQQDLNRVDSAIKIGNLCDGRINPNAETFSAVMDFKNSLILHIKMHITPFDKLVSALKKHGIDTPEPKDGQNKTDRAYAILGSVEDKLGMVLCIIRQENLMRTGVIDDAYKKGMDVTQKALALLPPLE